MVKMRDVLLNAVKKYLYRPLYVNTVLRKRYLKHHHQMLLDKGPELFKITLDACREVGLKPFLIWGSLLGYYRERGIIADDNDIDLGLVCDSDDLPARLEKLKEVMLKAGCTASFDEAAFEGKLKEVGIRSSGNFWMPEWSLWIDFYFFYPMNWQILYFEERRFGERYQKYLDKKKLSKLDHIGYVWNYPPDIFSALTPVTFLGSQVLIPTQTELYLTLTYGDWKKIVKGKYYANIQVVVWNAECSRFDFINARKPETS